MSDYWLVAERCVRLAIKEKDRGNQIALLDLAGEWLELAEQDTRTVALIAEVEALKRPVN